MALTYEELVLERVELLFRLHRAAAWIGHLIDKPSPKTIEEAREHLVMLKLVLENIDISQCVSCGKPVECVPDGLGSFCVECGKAEEKK